MIPAALDRGTTAQVFLDWLGVVIRFAVSVFWSFLAVHSGYEPGNRLFGVIAAGGSAGSLLGPTLAASLAETIGRAHLLIIAALLLEWWLYYLGRENRRATETRETRVDREIQDAGYELERNGEEPGVRKPNLVELGS